MMRPVYWEARLSMRIDDSLPLPLSEAVEFDELSASVLGDAVAEVPDSVGGVVDEGGGIGKV